MAWIKVPPEHRPIFLAALPSDPRVETMKRFGRIAAKVNGHVFAGPLASRPSSGFPKKSGRKPLRSKARKST